MPDSATRKTKTSEKDNRIRTSDLLRGAHGRGLPEVLQGARMKEGLTPVRNTLSGRRYGIEGRSTDGEIKHIYLSNETPSRIHIIASGDIFVDTNLLLGVLNELLVTDYDPRHEKKEGEEK